MNLTQLSSGTPRLDAALEYLEHDIVVVPIHPETKRPAIKWREFQERRPTEHEVTSWFEQWPDADIAIVTGYLSGMVVVDCDNEDALAFALAEGMTSPIRVQTKRGWHLYFKHPRDGVRRGPRGGWNSRNVDWPRINGLDFRGDGGYAVLPPSKGYEWNVPAGLDLFDDMPTWKDWSPNANRFVDMTEGQFSFDALDLTNVNGGTADEFVSEWDRTQKYARENFDSGKIPTGQGNGRNDRVLRYCSELVMMGHFGAELRMKAGAFMREFFEEPLRDREFEATCASVEQMERRNHPERFDDAGVYIYKNPRVRIQEEATTERRLIYVADGAQLVAASKATEFLIEPWLKRGTIVQVFGYSGHGKSLFVQNILYSLASGRRYFGPFEITKLGRVLYFDFENGPGTIGQRLIDMQGMLGDAGDRFGVWTPFLGEADINLNQAAGIEELEKWVRWYQPDVVVIDTIRSAWPGLQENAAEEWSKINRLAVGLRNAGLGVILLHHSNKPGDGGMGREAGSSNQLTVLETQIRITQVFEREDDADRAAGLFDGDYERPVWPLLRAKLPPGAMLQMVMEVAYGKVREWTPLHDRVQWVGFAADTDTDQRYVVGSFSTKQKAKEMALDGFSPLEIAAQLHRPAKDVRRWLGCGEP